MNDLERFVELYHSFGIDLVVNKGARKHLVKWSAPGYHYWIGLGGYGEDTTSSEKFDGYSGFYSIVLFDKDGAFVEQHFYE